MNSWFSAQLYLQDVQKWPLQLILRKLLIENSTDSMTGGVSADAPQLGETIKYAIVVVSTLPVFAGVPIFAEIFHKRGYDWSSEGIGFSKKKSKIERRKSDEKKKDFSTIGSVYTTVYGCCRRKHYRCCYLFATGREEFRCRVAPVHRQCNRWTLLF